MIHKLIREIDFGIIFLSNIFLLGWAGVICLFVYSTEPSMFNIANAMAILSVIAVNVLSFLNGLYFKKGV